MAIPMKLAFGYTGSKPNPFSPSDGDIFHFTFVPPTKGREKNRNYISVASARTQKSRIPSQAEPDASSDDSEFKVSLSLFSQQW